MPFTANHGVRIRYEVEGRGAPLVLMHGATVGLDMWPELGYTDALRDDFRVILIDARGHGQSDKPHDPAAYTPELMVSDVTAVLDALGIVQTHYLGASMGAAIGFAGLGRAPQRFRSQILLGYGHPGPRTAAQEQFVQMGLQLFGLGAAQGGQAVLDAIEGRAGPQPPVTRAQYLTNDWQALLALQTAFLTWPDQGSLLPTVQTPCLLVAAELDPFYVSAEQCAALLPNAAFLPIKQGSHSQNSYPADIVVPAVKAFLARVDAG